MRRHRRAPLDPQQVFIPLKFEWFDTRWTHAASFTLATRGYA